MGLKTTIDNARQQLHLGVDYFFPIWHFVFPTFVLICLQIICELSMPMFTADIVDIGIQQWGIESSAPEAMLSPSFDSLMQLMDSQSAKTAKGAYRKVSPGSSEAEALIEDYPVLRSQSIMVRAVPAGEIPQSVLKAFANSLHIRASLNNDTKDIAFAAVQNAVASLSPQDRSLLELDREGFLEYNNGSFIVACNNGLSRLEETAVMQSATGILRNDLRELGVDPDKRQIAYLTRSGLRLVGLAVAALLATLGVSFFAAIVSSRLGRDLRRDMYKKVLSLSSSEVNMFSKASLITRATSDVQQIQLASITALRVFITAPLLGVGGFVYALLTGFSLTWIIVCFAGFVVLLVGGSLVYSTPRSMKIQSYVDKLNMVMRETLKGVFLIRSFRAEATEEARIQDAARSIRKARVSLTRAMGVVEPLMLLSLNLATAVIVWFGAKTVGGGSMKVGGLLAFITYGTQVVAALQLIASLAMSFSRAFSSMVRVDDVLSYESPMKDLEEPKPFDPAKRGYVEFEGVSFSYADSEAKALDSISFVARPGQTTAIIGSTGSGKTTIASLIPRFQDATSGIVRVNGVNVVEASRASLRSEIGYVPQNSTLFTGTIESNIKFGSNKPTDESMIRAAKASQSLSFIDKKPGKFKAQISQSGLNVSGGQRQRLAIARACIKNPSVFVLDDAQSSLDYKTDALLRKSLRANFKTSSIIMIAQRVSTIKEADQIIVIDEGRIVGKGKHMELLKTCPEYQLLAASQLGEEVLSA